MLTEMLRESLDGHSKTNIIATISPAACDIKETHHTLAYASKAKAINICPSMNKEVLIKVG